METSPVNVDDYIISIPFFGCQLLLKLNRLGLLFPLTEFRAVARTYPINCSRMRQHNFDYDIFATGPDII